jgi:F0F1-type ATP synthase membrane subunit a
MLDLLTTLAFLLHGVQEGNPLVRLALRYSSNPLGGLLLVKMLALSLGFYCWRCGRQRLLTRINFLFAIVVAWNLLALIAGGLRTV